MATSICPYTGVTFNVISVENISLSFDQAVAIFILRQQGIKYHQITHLLGTNPLRVSEVLNRKVHGDAWKPALQYLAASDHRIAQV